MKEFVILVDSTSDLPLELRKEYNVDYVAMNYVVDGTEYIASLDWESHSPKDFYDLMRNGTRIFTTQVPQNVFYDAFKAIAESGKDVLYLGCSSALSASVKAAQVVAGEMKEEFPETTICCVDTLISGLAQGHLALEASRKRAEGLGVAEVAAYIESIKLCMNQCGVPASLEYLKRAGRVKASKAFFGNLFGIKPLIISDVKGQNYGYKKAKGAVNARIAVAEHIVEAADGVYDQLYIAHADCLEEAELLKEEILKRAAFKNVTMSYIGPIVGASVGPGTVAAYCYGKEVTIEGNE